MKTLNTNNFAPLTNEEMCTINGGANGLSSLNPTINGLLTDLVATSVVSIAGLDKTLTDLTTNLDALSANGLLSGGLLGGSGNGLLGGGLNL